MFKGNLLHWAQAGLAQTAPPGGLPELPPGPAFENVIKTLPAETSASWSTVLIAGSLVTCLILLALWIVSSSRKGDRHKLSPFDKAVTDLQANAKEVTRSSHRTEADTCSSVLDTYLQDSGLKKDRGLSESSIQRLRTEGCLGFQTVEQIDTIFRRLQSIRFRKETGSTPPDPNLRAATLEVIKTIENDRKQREAAT